MTTCQDGWSAEESGSLKRGPEERNSLESEGDVLCRIMRKMLDRRSKADLTPEYMIWLMHDARMFCMGSRLNGSYGMAIYNLLGFMRPSVERPPDMYSTNIEHGLMEKWARR
jgi:hypothetical protein